MSLDGWAVIFRLGHRLVPDQVGSVTLAHHAEVDGGVLVMRGEWNLDPEEEPPTRSAYAPTCWVIAYNATLEAKWASLEGKGRVPRWGVRLNPEFAALAPSSSSGASTHRTAPAFWVRPDGVLCFGTAPHMRPSAYVAAGAWSLVVEINAAELAAERNAIAEVAFLRGDKATEGNA